MGQRGVYVGKARVREFLNLLGPVGLKDDHTFNTWTAGYDGGWARSPGRTVPGPSRTFPPDTPPTFTFQMFRRSTRSRSTILIP